ncbi:MAG: NUDIX hydrolase [Patescibacteria group bacterium]|nr:NUDIX hydrolase [Patescibacteria group bacterium]
MGPKWDIIGGRINPGSSLVENLKREIKEEVNLNYSGEPKLVAAQDILRVPGRHVVRLTFAGELDGNPQIDGDHLESKWFTGGEISSMEEKVLDSYFKELIEKKIINFEQ